MPYDIIDAIGGTFGRIDPALIRESNPGWKPIGAARKILKRGGTSADVASTQLSEAGIYKGDPGQVDQLGEAINAAARARKEFRARHWKELKLTREEAADASDFSKAAIQGERPKGEPAPETVSIGRLVEGDEFSVKGHKFTVEKLDIDEDGNLLAVKIKDGPKYGVKVLDGDEVIHVDRGTLKEQPVEFLPKEQWGLDAPESVEAQKARLAQEAEQQRVKAERERIAELQSRPLVGSKGDIGQGGLFEREDLFQPPSAASKSSITVRQPPKGKGMVGLGGAKYGEVKAQPNVPASAAAPVAVPPKLAQKMEAQVKLPAQYSLDRLTSQFDLLASQIGDALTSGGRFLPKDLRPEVAKGAPAEAGTVTSKAVNQYFTSKLATLINELRRVKSEIAAQSTPEMAEYYDLVLSRAKETFRQVQELRRASHESLAFWNKIKAQMLDIRTSLGIMGELPRKLPILDQMAKHIREGDYKRAAFDLVEFARVNLFTLGSWTLDFMTNAAVAAAKVPAFAVSDLVSLSRGKPALEMASALKAIKNSAANLNPLSKRWRLPEEIEVKLGTTAGAEFQGFGREVMADFSEILKGHPDLANKLKRIDVMLSAPVRMKRSVDAFFGRLGAATELYHQAHMAGRKANLRGDDLSTFIENYVQTPPPEAIEAAVKQGKEWKFNRDLSEWEETFSRSVVTKVWLEAYPRWTFQFTRWAAEMFGLNPDFYRGLKNGTLTQRQAVDYLTKAATGWGGLVLFNQLVYDNIDPNTMEYVKEDGDRVRLSGRTPMPELYALSALLRGDIEKLKLSMAQTSFPLAKFFGGDPGGIISPVTDALRRSMEGRFTYEQTALEMTKLMNQLIPGKSVLGFMRALYDPSVREGFGAPVPGVASALPQRINPTTGEPLAPMQKIPGTNFKFPTVGGTPFPGAVRDLNAIEAVLLNHGIGTFRPRRTSLIELPAEDVPPGVRHEYEVLAGRAVKRILGELIAREDFWKESREVREKVLTQALSYARREARMNLAQKHGTTMKPVESAPMKRAVVPEHIKDIRPK